jgi:nucleoside 2-deoxyribosyltransferase
MWYAGAEVGLENARMIRTVYLAGPDVFLPNAVAVGRRKVELCAKYGFKGLFPLDNEIASPGPPRQHGRAIYKANVEMMLRADAILANLSPFRGISADAGTVFEVGFFAALGRPIFAYSNDARGFAERTRGSLSLDEDATSDADGAAIESFDLQENLMVPGAVFASGGVWIAKGDGASDLAALPAFTNALQAMCDFVRAQGGFQASAAR